MGVSNVKLWCFLCPIGSNESHAISYYRFNWLCAFFVTKFTKNINDGINPSGSYFLFGAIMFLSTLFVIFLTPETKGKTNEDMRAYFLAKAGRPIQNKTTGIENLNYEKTGEEKL